MQGRDRDNEDELKKKSVRIEGIWWCDWDPMQLFAHIACNLRRQL